MRLIGLAVVLAVSFALTPLATEAQQAPKIPKIGLLTLATPAAAAPLVEAFRQELPALGYVEGKTFVLQIRYGEAKTERLRELAASHDPRWAALFGRDIRSWAAWRTS